MTINSVLDRHGDAFAGEIARQAVMRASTVRMFKLTLCAQGMATKTDAVAVHGVNDAACWFFDSERLAYSMPMAEALPTLREILDSTAWHVSFYDEDHLSQELFEDIDRRLAEVRQ